MRLQEFCNENDLEVSHVGGFAITGQGGRRLTPFYESMEALEAAELPLADAILVADRVDPPSEETVARYRANLDKAEAAIHRGLPIRRAKYEELLPHAGNEIIDEVLRDVKRVVDAAPLHLAEIARCRTLSEGAPSRLFLPLGAAVRLKREWNVPDHYAIDPSIISHRMVARPPAGSVGYVTGAGYGSDECSIVVSFPDSFVDWADREWSGSLHGIRKVVHMSDVEVLRFATLPDGSPNLSVDGIRTHTVNYADEGEDEEDVADMMVLENGGKTMLFFLGDDFDPLDESVHFFASIEEAKDIHGDIESLASPATAL